MQNLKRLASVLIIAAASWALVGGEGRSAAQGDDQSCRVAVEQVYTAVQGVCADLPPASACAGTSGVHVVLETGETFVPAASMSLTGLLTIATDPYQLTGGEVGVIVLKVPGVGAGDSLTAVLYGAAILANVPGQPVAPTCSATSIGSVNVRAEPNTEAAILGQLTLDQSAPITARLPDSTWWRILWNGREAWVFAQLAPADCDPAAMLVYDPVTGEVSGGLPIPDFQNVRLATDSSAPACDGAPRGGLLLQSDPAGAAWIVNGLLLDLNGTVLLQAGTHDVLAVQVLAGQASLEAGGVTRLAGMSQLLRVPLQDGSLRSLPGPPLDAVLPSVEDAPLNLLPDPIVLPTVNHWASFPPDGADLACDLMTQSVEIAVDGSEAVLRVSAEGEQTIRVSAAAGGVRTLSVDSPAGANEVLVSQQGANASGALAADLSINQGGVYTFRAETVDSLPVRFGVTCGLPQPAAPPTLQSCESVLMSWDDVSGGSVRFTASSDAQVSIIAQHDLPSQAPAHSLLLLTETGEQVDQASFAAFQTRRAAGPLEVLLPRQATYILRWDGDPFNLVDIEVLCVMPES